MGTKETKKPLPTYEEAKRDWEAKLAIRAAALKAQQLAQEAYKKAVADSDKAYNVIQMVLEHDGTLPEYEED